MKIYIKKIIKDALCKLSDAQGRTSCVRAMPSNKAKNVGGCYI